MARISPQNALKLSAWIASQHPDLFRELVRQVTLLQRSPLGRLGFFGDDTDLLDTVTVTADAVPEPDFSNIDVSPVVDLSMSDIGFSADNMGVSSSTQDAIDQAISAPPTPDNTSSDTSGSFWSSIGSGVASVAGSIGKVASAFVNPQTLSAMANATGSFFTAQAKTAQAQAQASAQQAVLASQLARVGQGASPAPISYARNPATGAWVPVYNAANGTVPLTSGLLNQLARPQVAGLSLSPTVLIGGGLAVAIAITLLAAKR